MKFDQLDNEELVCFYLLMADGLDTFDSTIKEGGMSAIVDSPFGKVKVFKEFTANEIEEITSSDKYRLFKSIVTKLRPIVELIADSDPDLIDKTDKMLQINQWNEDQEEDL